MKKSFRYKSNNNGFTMVEIIVVLVVLSILAAILIPSAMGFFDILDTDEIKENAESIKNFAQVKIFDLYSEMSYNQDKMESIMDTNNISIDSAYYDKNNQKYNLKLNNFKDCDIHNSEFAKEILKELDIDSDSDTPNIVLLVLGRYDYYTDITKESYDPIKAYTIYDIVYQHKANDKIYYLFNGELLTEKNITRFGQGDGKNWYNSIEYNGEKVYVQYYLLKSYKKDNNGNIVTQTIGNDFWTYFNNQYNTYNK